MTIEVTSVPDQRRISLRQIPQFVHSLFVFTPTNERFVFRTLCGLLAIVLIVGGDSLLRSYKYYSRIIDARLASGYLTSRPGLYAAPRRIQPGQKLLAADLLSALRRAGYVESEGSNVWSGTFYESESVIEIRPARTTRSEPSVVRVKFGRDKTIAELTGDDLPVESFTLEPEVLSNDISSKANQRDALTFSEIPTVLVHAILSIEDQRFFDHSGLDIFGIGRAVMRNAGDDGVGQGGSTITQQLVKNTYLTAERTLRRKYAEAMLAFALERRLTKHDIFALYCNEVYLGQRGAVAVRGVKQAARIYFGKELKDISTAEAATIAGMIQGPAHYSPARHAEAARSRRNAVLAAMVRDRWIENEQAAAILAEPVVVSTGSQFDSLAPYFVDYVNRTAESEFEASPGSRRVFTTIDLDLQQLAERALKHQLDRLDGVYKNQNTKPQAALVALDPKTGNVLAMVGGRDYADSQLNRATDARRQPGSTFKPFVYAAALEDGMSPVQMFSDAPREFIYDRDKTYRPANFGGGYSMQDVTMRTGLLKSLNVVTVDIALQTGLARIANLTERFGLPKPERYPSLALGTKEVTPLELAAAYAAFVNSGHRVKPKVITSVGEPPATHSAGTSAADVISPTTAYMITNMLSAVVDHGTGRAARDVAKLTAVAGKTGTSRDGWFVGYTPNLVCVVWVGFDDNQQLGLTGAEAALPAWAEFIKESVALRPELGGRNFECPEGIKFVEIDADDGALSTLTCPHRELIAVTERLAPNLECYRHGNLRPDEGITVESETEMERTPSVARHSGKSMRSQASKSPFLATRVDTTNRRVALVTDMR
jgi:penicillin-binding protein 1B